jgi:membrane-bound serine protease (ClpP class)
MLKKSFVLCFGLIMILQGLVFSKEKVIVVAEIKEAITPVTQRYIERVLKEAQNKKVDAVLFFLDTPGGLLESTRGIVQALLNIPVDTIVYVSPQGARAGSAGVFITLSAKYAAMAPGCNIGAAHPVSMGGMGGEEKETENAKTLAKKIENDTIAFIESIAKLRKRNVDWAVQSVKQSVSITSEEALKKGIINHVASDKEELLKQIYGDQKFTFVEVLKNWAEGLLSVLANPNLVYFLLILGFYGIIYEIIHPGTIFSGALGALLLITALYSMQSLPFSFAGLLLIVLAFILFVLEFFIVSHGLLTVGGAVSLILGSAMLFDSPLPFFRLSFLSILLVTASTLLIVGGLAYLVSKVIRRKASSGREGMVGQKGIVLEDFLGRNGKVKIHGEIWNAVSEKPYKKGDEVIIEGMDQLTLLLK